MILSTAWVAFATWDIGGGDDIIKVYIASDTFNKNSSQNDIASLPSLIQEGVSEYLVSKNQITLKVNDLLFKYEECNIFSKYDWSCTFPDESATFGFKSKDYFLNLNIIKYPHLSEYKEDIYLSRFNYVILGCRWDLLNEPIQLTACLSRPFTI